ncbi:MAG TPA: ASCH domain-containing protein [Anaerolineales bacterium]|nr:ASCH domain-containing protein [Anaerolineales bacterium]
MDKISHFWNTFLKSLPDGEELTYASQFAFGDSPQLADTLAQLVLVGKKTATCDSLWAYQANGESLPQAGSFHILLDGAQKPLAVLQTTQVEICNFDEVSADFAANEGEDDCTLESWRREHWKYFSRTLPALGYEPSPNMPLVCERFQVVYAQHSKRTHFTTHNESHLHATLKQHYQAPLSRTEVDIDGYVVDVVWADGTCIEVQTANVGQMKAKLRRLLAKHTVRLVLPVALEKWIVKEGVKPSRRRSPKKGNFWQAFRELSKIAPLLTQPNLQVDILLVKVEDVRMFSTQRASWRRVGYSTVNRRLLQIVATHALRGTPDWQAQLPTSLAQPFTTKHFAEAAGCSVQEAQAACYTLARMDILQQVGKLGRANLWGSKDEVAG